MRQEWLNELAEILGEKLYAEFHDISYDWDLTTEMAIKEYIWRGMEDIKRNGL